MKSIDNTCIEQISRILGELTTGSKITKMFKKHSMIDHDTQVGYPMYSTKWKRLNASIVCECRNHSSAQPLFTVIEDIMNPAYFVTDDDPQTWYKNKSDINQILVLYGYELNDGGKIKKVVAANTFTEAKQRYESFRDRLDYFNIHTEVIKYCTPELLEHNYFHAIFEASKGIFDRLRYLTTSTKDGNSIINEAFNVKNPAILIENNMLQSQDDCSEYLGLKSLLNTICYIYRNPKAHSPKLYNETSEEDAIAAFILMSQAHKQLDRCTCIINLD